MPVSTGSAHPTLPLSGLARWPAGVVAVATLALVLALLLLRRPDVLWQPQFWAEEGAIFFAQQWLQGAAAWWQPYAGYLHGLPRAVAAAAAAAPPAWAPAIYIVAAALITLASAAMVLEARLPFRARPALALAMVAVPAMGEEVALTMTNAQWITALALLATLCKTRPATRWQAALDHGVVVLCGLTGPFAALWLPFFALRVWREPQRCHRSLLVTLAAVSAIQALSVLQRIGEVKVAEVGDLHWLAPLLAQRVVGDLFLPGMPPLTGAAVWLGLMALVLVALFAGWLLRRTPWQGLLLLGGAATVLAAVLYKSVPQWPLMVNAGADTRYFYLPHVALVWALLQGAAAERTAVRVLCAALLLLALASSLWRGFPAQPRADLQWGMWAQRIGKEAVAIPIHPRPWVITLPAEPPRR